MDTIFALATARGRAGVAIVRISGPDAVRVTSLLCETVPKNRGIRRLTDSDGDLIDVALVLQFASGQSFTGEQTVELHLHGSPAIVDAVTGVLADHARPAEAGEFTRRALENGRLDLAQVEGLADLIDAETEAQRKQAVRVFDGALGDLANAWRSQLVRSAALIEATIDFADEDVPEDVLPEVRNILMDVQASLQTQISGFHAAERVRDGFEVAIVGPPNAGKSTLLNRLAGRDAAITSEIAGTTRDVIEVRMDLSGIPVTFLDTAGLRDSEDTVEQLGVDLAVRRAKAADLRIFLSADDLNLPIEKMKDDLSVAGKADLNPVDGLAISGVTGEGVQLLVDRVTQVLAQRAGQAGVALRDRHRAAMTVTSESIETVFDHIDNEVGLDLVAQELRLAIGSVDMIVGRVDVEDLLDEIFSSFCIGK